MTQEDYCSFEVAKLLKEKGFNWEWSPFYSEQDRDEWAKDNNYNIPNPNYDATIPFDSEILNVIAPHVSLQMAMKWLREKHIIVTAQPAFFDYDGNCTDWRVEIWCDDNYEEINLLYKTYEEAVEAALKYCLTKLI